MSVEARLKRLQHWIWSRVHIIMVKRGVHPRELKKFEELGRRLKIPGYEDE